MPPPLLQRRYRSGVAVVVTSVAVLAAAAAAAARRRTEESTLIFQKQRIRSIRTSGCSRISVCRVPFVIETASYDEEGRMLGNDKRGRWGIRDEEERGGGGGGFASKQQEQSQLERHEP